MTDEFKNEFRIIIDSIKKNYFNKKEIHELIIKEAEHNFPLLIEFFFNLGQNETEEIDNRNSALMNFLINKDCEEKIIKLSRDLKKKIKNNLFSLIKCNYDFMSNYSCYCFFSLFKISERKL